MELGFDAVLLNTAVAKSSDPVRMAGAFARAIEAGYQARQAGMMERRDMAAASTPVFGWRNFAKEQRWHVINDRQCCQKWASRGSRLCPLPAS